MRNIQSAIFWPTVRPAYLFVLIVVSMTANSQEPAIERPEYKVVDTNGVDLMSGKSTFEVTTVQIGSSARPLIHTMFSYNNVFPSTTSFADNFMGRLSGSGIYNNNPAVIVTFARGAERFYLNGGVYHPVQQNGTLLIENADGTFTFTQRDGTIFIIQPAITIAGFVDNSHRGTVTQVTQPDGVTIDIHFKSSTFNGQTYHRIQSVTRNDGYQIKYGYQRNAAPTDSSTFGNWARPTSVKAINNAVDYCAPLADSCAFSRSWPTATIDYVFSTPPPGALIGGMTLTVTDSIGRSTRYTHTVDNLELAVTGVKAPTSAVADTATYEYDELITCGPSGCDVLRKRLVSVVNIGGATWIYWYTPAGPYDYATESRGPTNTTMRVVYNTATGELMNIQTPDGKHAFFESYGLINRLDRVVFPEGNFVKYSYDGRGNITEERSVAKAGSGLADILRTANFDGGCSEPKTCNRPNWVKDGRGNQTDYTYYPGNGQIKSVALPPDSTGIRPQTRYVYAQRYARIKASGGGDVQVNNPIWVLVEESHCQSSTASASGCSAANDEVTVTYDYGPVTGLNNLNLRGRMKTTGSTSIQSCFSYDDLGNRISETTPNANLASCQ
jgi:YD repeat-containing protein